MIAMIIGICVDIYVYISIANESLISNPKVRLVLRNFASISLKMILIQTSCEEVKPVLRICYYL